MDEGVGERVGVAPDLGEAPALVLVDEERRVAPLAPRLEQLPERARGLGERRQLHAVHGDALGLETLARGRDGGDGLLVRQHPGTVAAPRDGPRMPPPVLTAGVLAGGGAGLGGPPPEEHDPAGDEGEQLAARPEDGGGRPLVVERRVGVGGERLVGGDAMASAEEGMERDRGEEGEQPGGEGDGVGEDGRRRRAGRGRRSPTSTRWACTSDVDDHVLDAQPRAGA